MELSGTFSQWHVPLHTEKIYRLRGWVGVTPGARRAEEGNDHKFHWGGGQNLSQKLPSSQSGSKNVCVCTSEHKVSLHSAIPAGDQADVLPVPGQEALHPPPLHHLRLQPLPSTHTWWKPPTHPCHKNVTPSAGVLDLFCMMICLMDYDMMIRFNRSIGPERFKTRQVISLNLASPYFWHVVFVPQISLFHIFGPFFPPMPLGWKKLPILTVCNISGIWSRK